MRLLVTGGAGMLGTDVVALAARTGHEAVGLPRARLDITDADAVARVVAEHRPSAVINCAAWTDVDGAEEREEDATRINGEGPGHLARACAEYGALLVHVSSDYVFDGEQATGYVESDPTGPIGAYGRSKLAGELAVQSEGDRYAIVRSSWLFGLHGRNFADTMLKLAQTRDELTVVDDQIGCPTYTGHLAGALLDIAERDLTGMMHVAGGGPAVSWHGFAVQIFARAGVDAITVHPGTTADLGRPAPRPAFSALLSERDDLPVLAPWQDGLDAYLAARAALSQETTPS